MTKREILEELKRDELIAAVERFKLESMGDLEITVCDLKILGRSPLVTLRFH